MDCDKEGCRSIAKLTCGRCCTASYCSLKCYRADAAIHRPKCFTTWASMNQNNLAAVPNLRCLLVRQVNPDIFIYRLQQFFWQFGAVAHTARTRDTDRLKVMFVDKGPAIRCLLSKTLHFETVDGNRVELRPEMLEDEEARDAVNVFLEDFRNTSIMPFRFPPQADEGQGDAAEARGGGEAAGGEAAGGNGENDEAPSATDASADDVAEKIKLMLHQKRKAQSQKFAAESAAKFAAAAGDEDVEREVESDSESKAAAKNEGNVDAESNANGDVHGGCEGNGGGNEEAASDTSSEDEFFDAEGEAEPLEEPAKKPN